MYEKLVNYAAKQLELDPAEITPDATFESLGIDSLDIVEMIMDLCISSFSNRRIGGKDSPERADTIARGCLKKYKAML